MSENNTSTSAIDALIQETLGAKSSSKDDEKKLHMVSKANKKIDPAVENAAVRSKIEAPVDTGKLKFVARPRVFGTRNSGGSRLAKSTLRLGLDTKHIDQVKFEKGLTIDENQMKPKIKTTECSVDKAMALFEDFEKRFGSKSTTTFQSKLTSYRNEKELVLKELRISTNSKGQPIWSDENQSKTYFDRLRDKSFIYWEIYLSYKPDNVRASQTRKAKFLSLEEALQLFSKETTDGWLN